MTHSVNSPVSMNVLFIECYHCEFVGRAFQRDDSPVELKSPTYIHYEQTMFDACIQSSQIDGREKTHQPELSHRSAGYALASAGGAPPHGSAVPPAGPTRPGSAHLDPF